MRIGVDATVLEAGHRTGVARYLQNLVAHWGREPQGHEFVAYHSRLTPSDAALQQAPFRLRRVLPIPFVQSYTHPQRLLWEQVALPLAAERDGLDVLFSPGYTAPLHSPCPGVVTIHDISFSVRPEWYSSSARWMMAPVSRAAARRRQAVLTDSNFSRDEIARVYGVSASRVRVIPIAGDPAFVPGDAAVAAARAAALTGGDDRFLLFVGTMYRRRRVAHLIRAFDAVAAKIPGVRLVLVGSDPDGELARGLAAISARERVVRLAHVSEPELVALYQACAGCVYLSEYEGFGLPVVEAMACGAPVVTSQNASLPEVAGDAALYVALDDEAALVEALVRLLTETDLEHTLRERGPRRASLFRWEECAAQTLAVLEAAAVERGTLREPARQHRAPARRVR